MAAVAAEDGGILPRLSGRYQYKFWQWGPGGDRRAVMHAPVGRTAPYPDLINTAYLNQDKTRTVYGIVFDFDAHRARAEWLDAAGCLDWPKIQAKLAADYPDISARVTHVVRSSGMKGLAVVVGLNPLPIIPATKANQRSALNLQHRLIHLFTELGFGCDPSARGLERDFPNFKDPGRSVFRNPFVQRRMEEGREAVVSHLHKFLNGLEAARRKERRLYPDLRAERGLAKLCNWLFGAEDPGHGVKVPGYFAGEEAWASTRQLEAITGLSGKFLRRCLKDPPSWLHARYVQGEGWGLAVPLGRATERLLPRVEELLRGRSHAQKLSVSLAHLKRPESVEDGERNTWLTAVCLAYKWSGLERPETLAKILLRMAHVPGFEHSRNCRQVRSIVKAIYRNVPETFGMWRARELPSWLVNDKEFFVDLSKGTSPRRGVAPDKKRPPARGQRAGARESGESTGDEVSRPKPESIFPALVIGAAGSGGKDSYQKSPDVGEGIAAQDVHGGSRHQSAAGYGRTACEQSEAGESPRVVKLMAVRRGQRVGIFEGAVLVLCTTKRHYRASLALEHLSRRERFKGMVLKVSTPHRNKQAKYFAAIDGCEDCENSAVLFGAKETFGQKWGSWAADKGIATSTLNSTTGAFADEEPPPF